jgi:hypothetical protein
MWIDHRKAVIVSALTDGEHIDTVLSNVETHLERAGESPLNGPYVAQHVPTDDKRQRALTGASERVLRRRHHQNRGLAVYLGSRRGQRRVETMPGTQEPGVPAGRRGRVRQADRSAVWLQGAPIVFGFQLPPRHESDSLPTLPASDRHCTAQEDKTSSWSAKWRNRRAATEHLGW